MNKKDKIKRNYPCSDKVLIVIADLVAMNCLKLRSDFDMLVPGYYNDQFFIDFKARLDVAGRLPSYSARISPREVNFSKLETLRNEALTLANFMERYLVRAYSQADFDIYIKPIKRFRKSGNTDWSATKILLDSINIFIEQHAQTLQQKGFMPSDFIQKCALLQQKFKNVFVDFGNSKSDAITSTHEKILYLNAIYDTVRIICDDGQAIFANDPINKKHFVFDEMMLLVAGAGIGGLRGKISDSVSKRPVRRVIITILPGDKKAISLVNGRYTIKQLAAGNYTIRIEHPNYNTVIIESFTIETGVTSKLNVVLVPLAPPEEKQEGE